MENAEKICRLVEVFAHGLAYIFKEATPIVRELKHKPSDCKPASGIEISQMSQATLYCKEGA